MAIALKVAATNVRSGKQRILAETRPDPNPWEKYKLKLMPKRINGKWYRPGEWVYRRWVMSPGGGYWKYGDDFDYMRGQ